MAEDIPLQTAQAVGTLFEPNMEALANLGPDLIIAGGRSAAQVQPLSKIAPTIDMTIARARANIATYGALFGKQNKAAELVAFGAAVSFEFIAEVHPDWLSVVDRSVVIGEVASAQTILDNPLVAGTTATQKGQIIALSAAPIYIAGGGL